MAATPAGLRVSHDGGRHWTVVGPPLVPPMELAVPAPSFAPAGLVLAATADGVQRSTDGGTTWTPTLVGSRVLAIVFASTRLVLVGTEDDGILRSEDAGQSWRSGNPGLLDLTVLGLACSPDFETDHTLFAATGSGLFVSRNAGRAWRAVESLPGEPDVQCVAVLPGAVLAGTHADGLFHSDDGGASWTAIHALAGRSIVSLAACDAGQRLAAATDAGVAVSDDAGTTWRWVGAVREPFLCVAFVADGALLGGLPRRGVLRSTHGDDWQTADDGLRANLVVGLAAAADGSLYLAGLEDGLEVSSDGGRTWRPAWPERTEPTTVFGISEDAAYAATSQGAFGRDMRTGTWQQLTAAGARAVCSNGRSVAALNLSGDVSLSDDGGATWRALTLPADAAAPTCVGLARGGALLVGTQHGLWRVVPSASSTWQRILVAPDVACLAIAPTYPVDGMVFVGAGSDVWWPARDMLEVVRGERRPVWRHARTGGRTVAVATSPAFQADHCVLVGTSAGVVVSTDMGEHFRPWSEGLGETSIVSVAFSATYATDRLVYAVELGGRLWRRRT